MPSNHHSMSSSHPYYDPSDSVAASNGCGGDSGFRDHGASSAHGVVISHEEYEILSRSCSEYNALRNTLLAGGVTIENLQILINTGLQAQLEEKRLKPVQDLQADADDSLENYSLPTKSSVRMSRDPNVTNGNGNGDAYGMNASSKPKSKPPTSPIDATNGDDNSSYNYNGNKRRTLFFTNVPKHATYHDLLDVVRGGALVDAWMKSNYRCASVSFVNPADAEAYFRYTKKNDIYIKGHRVDIKWREPGRQFVILRNVSRQIQHDGASRVLMLRSVPPTLTEERLRDDLDHIANLFVERILVLNGGRDIQCNLNSICVALFAKTCLRSRAYYKVCKIEFGIDECSKPLPDLKEYKEQPQVPKRQQHRENKFDALFADDGGEENCSGSEDEAVSVSTFTQDDDEASTCESWADSTTAQGTIDGDGSADLGGYW